MINYLIRIKIPFELILCSLLILLFGLTNQQFFLLLVVLIGVGITATLPFSRCIVFAVFLLPNFEVFTQTTYVPFSLATLIFLAMFGRYLLTQFYVTNYYKPGLIFTLIIILFELLHLIYNPVMFSAKTIRWLLLFLFVSLIIFDRKNYADFKSLRECLFLGLIVSTGYGLLNQYFFPPEYVHEKAISRFAGGAGDPNNFGLYCLILIYFFLPTVPKNSISKVSFFVLGVMLFCGALTVSRSFFIVSFMSLFLYFILYFRDAIGEVFIRILILIVILIICFAIFQLAGESFAFKFDILTRFSGDNLSELTGARSDIVQEYLNLFFDLPLLFVLFGAGINGYLGYYNHFFELKGLFPEVVGPHNTFIEILISFGVVGCLFFLGYILSAFKAEKTRVKNGQVFRIALLPLVVFLLYCFSLQNLGKYGSFFILMLIIYHTYRKEN